RTNTVVSIFIERLGRRWAVSGHRLRHIATVRRALVLAASVAFLGWAAGAWHRRHTGCQPVLASIRFYLATDSHRRPPNCIGGCVVVKTTAAKQNGRLDGCFGRGISCSNLPSLLQTHAATEPRSRLVLSSCPTCRMAPRLAG